jgi:hypothetical protein
MTITADRPRAASVLASPVSARLTAWLAAHSVTALRVSLGLIILGFGALKYVPGASPAEPLVLRTVDTLSLGLVSGTPAVVATAVLETFIGLTLITGIGLRVGLVALAGALVGMMSPLVLFFGDMFPGYLPTLEAQYVLKDIILAAAAAVVAARTLGARYILPRPTTPPARPARQIVVAGREVRLRRAGFRRRGGGRSTSGRRPGPGDSPPPGGRSPRSGFARGAGASRRSRPPIRRSGRDRVRASSPRGPRTPDSRSSAVPPAPDRRRARTAPPGRDRCRCGGVSASKPSPLAVRGVSPPSQHRRGRGGNER